MINRDGSCISLWQDNTEPYVSTNKPAANIIYDVIIVGGGITNPEKAYLNCKAGADLIVVGNAIEKDASLIKEMAAAIHSVPVKI